MNKSDVYPIGTYAPAPFSEAERQERLGHLRDLPRLLEGAVEGLTDDDLARSYRAGTWSIQQLVHHVSDSHRVGFLRHKLVVTMDTPSLPVYDQDAFAETPDVLDVPINHALTELHVIHAKWYELLKDLEADAWTRVGYHPEQDRNVDLWFLLGLYAWHGRHHAMQIIRWRERTDR